MRTQHRGYGLKVPAIIFGLAITAALMLFAYRITDDSPHERETVVSAIPAGGPDTKPGTSDPSAVNAAGEREQKKVKTITIRPDSNTSRKWAEDSQRLGLSSTTSPNQIVPTPSEPTKVKTIPIRPDYAAPGNATTQRREPASPAVRGGPSDPAGGYLVVVASQRTEADAEVSYRMLQEKYPALLGHRRGIVTRADLGERGVYYRAQVGPFASADEAAGLCNSLKEVGGRCVVERGQAPDRP